MAEKWKVIARLPLLQPRYEECISGFVEYPDGNRGILVSGGYRETSTIFLNLATLEWESKADLPFDISRHEDVPYGKSVLVFGGSSDNIDEDLDTIYFYDPEVDEWQLKGNMKYPKYHFPAFLVPDDYANCSP